MIVALLVIIIILLLAYICCYRWHVSNLLKKTAHALDEGDYSFRLTQKKHSFAGRAVTDSINNIVRHASIECQGVEEQAWERLIRILTHEIMNGIAPVSSLSNLFLNDEVIKKSHLYDGMKAINDTSNSLMNFVKSYRKYTVAHDMTMETFSVREIIDGIASMAIIPKDIKLNIVSDARSTMVYADKSLLTQALVNVVKNATESFKRDEQGRLYLHDAMIQIFLYQYSGTPLRLRISNNGEPIPKEVRDDIFIPFYTTKREGSGIGLALCRQVLRSMKGTICLLPATNGWNTSFLIEIPVADERIVSEQGKI